MWQRALTPKYHNGRSLALASPSEIVLILFLFTNMWTGSVRRRGGKLSAQHIFCHCKNGTFLGFPNKQPKLQHSERYIFTVCLNLDKNSVLHALGCALCHGVDKNYKCSVFASASHYDNLSSAPGTASTAGVTPPAKPSACQVGGDFVEGGQI